MRWISSACQIMVSSRISYCGISSVAQIFNRPRRLFENTWMVRVMTINFALE